MGFKRRETKQERQDRLAYDYLDEVLTVLGNMQGKLSVSGVSDHQDVRDVNGLINDLYMDVQDKLEDLAGDDY